jgi:hypothetical protein
VAGVTALGSGSGCSRSWSSGAETTIATRRSDDDLVAALLGRPPKGSYRVALRRLDGSPVVIENAPVLDDGTPMPTLYWLVDRELRRAVSSLESAGGVKRAEQEVDARQLEDSHSRYAEARDRRIAELAAASHRPRGGVGGTRQGVKCLHAHLAWHLVGGNDPVGRLVVEWLGLDMAGFVLEEGCG